MRYKHVIGKEFFEKEEKRLSELEVANFGSWKNVLLLKGIFFEEKSKKFEQCFSFANFKSVFTMHSLLE